MAMSQLLSMMGPEGRPRQKKMVLLVFVLVSNCEIQQSALH